MHEHDPAGWAATLNAFANLAIVGGYFLVPFTVLRRLPLTRFVQIAGVIFFGTCGLTHLAMAVNGEHHWLLIANHVVQAGAVWCFVVGFARLVTDANRRRAHRGGDPAGAER